MKKYHKLRIGRTSPELHLPPPTSEWVQYLLVIILAIVPYIPSIDGDFVFDDAESIVNNPVVNGKIGLETILTKDFWGQEITSAYSHKSFRPITTLTFWLNYQLSGLATRGYHLVNILLHVINSILVLKLSKSFKCSAFVSAAIFAVHPVHSEAVANITGRAELLMTFFCLSALLCHLNFNSNSFILGSLTLLSMLSKEQGVMTLPIIISIDFIFKKKKNIFLAVMFFVLVAIRISINGTTSAKFTRLDNSAAFIENPIWRMINYSYLWLYHLYLLIYPANLCFDYSMGCIEPISRISDWRALSPVLIGLGFVISYRLAHLLPEKRFAIFAIIFGLLAYLPSSNLLVTVGFTVAERILYLPSVPFCILCGIVYSNSNWNTNRNFIVFSLVFLAASRTFTRSEEWRNELSLYHSGLSVCPNNAKIHYNIGKVMGDLGRIKDAEQNYWNAIRLNPTYEQALNNLGNILQKEGEARLAEDLLRRATELKPNFAAAWMNLGIVQMNLGKLGESEKSFKRSISIRPASAHCLFNLGVLYNKLAKVEEAVTCWENATRIDPNHKQSWTNLLVGLDELNHCEKVLSLASKALSIGSEESSIHMQIGSCLAQNGDTIQARIHVERAVELSPGSAVYRANLGVLYQRTQQWERAKTEYRRALKIDKKMEMAETNLRTVENILTAINSTVNL